jgi:hypothetical protein
MGHVSQKFFGEEGRTDERLVEGVGAGGGQLGSSVGEGRSLLVDQSLDVELTQRGAARHQKHEECRDGRSSKVWRRRCLESTAAGKFGTDGFE